jgi:hypothetical protein
MAAGPTRESLFLSQLARNTCHTYNLSSMDISWLHFIFSARPIILSQESFAQNLQLI